MIWLLALYAVVYIAAINAIVSTKNNIRALLVATFMLAMMFGVAKVKIEPWLILNFACVWYGSIIAFQAMIAVKFSTKYSIRTALLTLKLVLFVQVNLFITQHMPQIGTAKELAMAVNNSTILTTIARFAALILGTGFVTMFAKYMVRTKLVFLQFALITLIAHIITSLTFFPLAYSNDPDMIQIMIAGIIVKWIISLTFYPLMKYIKDDKMMKEI